MSAKPLAVAAVLVATLMTVGSMAGVGVPAVEASTADAAEAGRAHGRSKGPVGWDVYRQLDRLPELGTGVQTRQFSSFDRTGGNADAVTSSCLRTSADGCVIAEAAGAGEVQSIWFTRNLADPGNVEDLGRLIVELDGEVVLDVPAQDVVDGDLGAPFVFPLVANRDQSSGGVYVRVPMPYRESMRITTSANAWFYHVTYRAFADAEGVSTFDPSDPAEDVIAMLRAAGTADPKPPRKHSAQETISAGLAAGTTIDLASLDGPGSVDELAVRIPEIVGPHRPATIRDDGRGLVTPVPPGPDPVTEPGRPGGTSGFTAAIDPGNAGVRLTRRANTYWATTQVANVFVDGVQVGTWPSLTGTNVPRWADVTLDLPRELTAGRSAITIQTRAVESIFGNFEEFRYEVDSLVGESFVRTDEIDIGLQSVVSESAHGYTIDHQGWAGALWNAYPPTGDADAIARSDELLRDLRLRVTVDDATTVDAPLGEFFGTGLGEYPVRSLFFAVDTAPDGWYRAWWPMPFARSARVELVNDSEHDVELVDASLRWSSSPHHREGLAEGRVGTFRATSRTGRVVDGRDWSFLDTAGTGRFVGVSHTMLGEQLAGSINSRGYLEGDERVYVDGSRTPQLHGTGSEDFYEGAWYFATGPFSNPFTGNVAAEVEELGCGWVCDSTYRLMIGDAVPFSSDLRFGMEHGGENEWPAVYGSTAFWYGSDAASARVTDVVDVGDAAGEGAHEYAGGGDVVPLTSVYEGDDDETVLTDDGRASTEPVSFTVRTGRRHDTVSLRRRSDQAAGYQRAEVFVDGEPAGQWLQPLANAGQRWADDTFTLPPALTRGRDELEIRIEPVDDSPAWHAARYEVHTHSR